MQKPLPLLLLALTFTTVSYSQPGILKIDPGLDSIRKTNVCTEFQYWHCLKNGTAKLTSDTLKIRFYSQTASTLDDLSLYVIGDKVHSTYRTVYVADTGGKNEWIPVKQLITLNSNKFPTGKKIRGHIEVEFQEIYIHQNGEREETGIIKFSGPFTVKIK